MNFLLLNPTAMKKVLSKKLELYLEADKFPPAQTKMDCSNF